MSEIKLDPSELLALGGYDLDDSLLILKLAGIKAKPFPIKGHGFFIKDGEHFVRVSVRLLSRTGWKLYKQANGIRLCPLPLPPLVKL